MNTDTNCDAQRCHDDEQKSEYDRLYPGFVIHIIDSCSKCDTFKELYIGNIHVSNSLDRHACDLKFTWWNTRAINRVTNSSFPVFARAIPMIIECMTIPSSRIKVPMLWRDWSCSRKPALWQWPASRLSGYFSVWVCSLVWSCLCRDRRWAAAPISRSCSANDDIMQNIPAKAPYDCHPSVKQGLLKFSSASGSICTNAVARITPVPTIFENQSQLCIFQSIS